MKFINSRIIILAVLLGGTAISASGCGPVQATTAIAESKKALSEAKEAAADTLAAYPYYRAEAYLYMAKTKWGFAEYEIAREFAGRAKDEARKAEEKARRRYRFMKLREARMLENGGGTP